MAYIQWLKHESSGVISFAFSPDGTILATSSSNNTVALVDTASHTMRHRITDFTDEVTYLKFSPDGTVLATVSRYSDVLLVDTASGRVILKILNDSSAEFCFSHDLALLAIAESESSYDRSCHTVVLTDLLSGSVRFKLHPVSPGTGSPNLLAVSLDKLQLAIGWDDGSVHVVNASSGKTRHKLALFKTSVARLLFLPNGMLVTNASNERLLALVDPTAGVVRKWFTDHSYNDILAVSPDGSLLAKAKESEGSIVELVDARTGVVRHELTHHKKRIWNLAFLRGGSLLATFSADGSATLVDPVSAVVRRTVKHKLIGYPKFAFSPDGTQLALGPDGADFVVTVVEISSGVVYTLRTQPDDAARSRQRTSSGNEPAPAFRGLFSPDGNVLAIESSPRFGQRCLGLVSVSAMKECRRREDSMVDAAPVAPRPWIKQWDRPTKRVCYRNPTDPVRDHATLWSIAEVAEAIRTKKAKDARRLRDEEDRLCKSAEAKVAKVKATAEAKAARAKAAADERALTEARRRTAGAPPAPKPWMKTWNTVTSTVEYHNPDTGKSVKTVAAAVAEIVEERRAAEAVFALQLGFPESSVVAALQESQGNKDRATELLIQRALLPADGLLPRVDAIRSALEITTPARQIRTVIREANALLGIAGGGPLPGQVTRIMTMLGL
eukprot:m.39021 g.39021  ORF g.39021 m.39021 type:complete len:668 (-) comp13556_c0_seq2:11-2014(-)